jgi:hypothetical protein
VLLLPGAAAFLNYICTGKKQEEAFSLSTRLGADYLKGAPLLT